MDSHPNNMKELLVEYFTFAEELATSLLAKDYIDQTDMQQLMNEHRLLVQRVDATSGVPDEIKRHLNAIPLSSKIQFLSKNRGGLRDSLRYLWLNIVSYRGGRLGDEQCLRDRLSNYRDQMSHFRFTVEKMTTLNQDLTG